MRSGGGGAAARRGTLRMTILITNMTRTVNVLYTLDD